MAKSIQDITAFAYDKKGRLISKGKCNYVKTHPLQAKLCKHTDNPHRIYLHAELDALIKARGRQVHRLEVFRVKPDGNYGNAKPCELCQDAIELFKVKEVWYTT